MNAPSPHSASLNQKPLVSVRGGKRLAFPSIRELLEFRFLLVRLTHRDITLRYRQTALGVAWVVLQPLLGAGILSFVFGRIAGMASDGVPYYVMSFAGFLGWNAFSSVLTRTTTSLVSNSSLVSKVYFPRLLLPLSTVGSTSVDVGVGVIVMAIVLLVAGVGISLKFLLVFPILVLLMFLALGLGSICAALAVPYRDVNYLVPVAVQFLLYATPVGYSLNAVPPSARPWLSINPLVGLLELTRWSLLPDRPFSVAAVAWGVAATFVLCVFGVMYFTRSERGFADVL